MTREIILRKAQFSDCDAVFSWRNAPETRRYFFDPSPISRKAHQQWFHNILKSEQSLLLIGEFENSEPVGVLRYDLKDNNAEVSIYLVPEKQGQGLGSQLLEAGSAWLRKTYPHLKAIEARILTENTASHKAFEKAGYRPSSTLYTRKLQE